MTEETAGEIGPWPRAGEIWIPAMPWPTHECPAGLYVHHFSTVLVGGHAGYAWGIVGAPFAVIGIGEHREPVSHERAVMETWELRYGAAEMKPAEARASGGALLIDAVGAEWVYGRDADGRTVRVPARDLRLGFARVDTVEIIEHGHEGDEPNRTRVSAQAVAATIAPMLELGGRADDEWIAESAAELLLRGVLQFEGDPSISIRRCL